MRFSRMQFQGRIFDVRFADLAFATKHLSPQVNHD
jgi:hypothetical protein